LQLLAAASSRLQSIWLHSHPALGSHSSSSSGVSGCNSRGGSATLCQQTTATELSTKMYDEPCHHTAPTSCATGIVAPRPQHSSRAGINGA